MIRRETALRWGECLLWRACRRLPIETRKDRFEEWAAELPVILDDTDVWFRPIRIVRELAFAADQLRTVRHADGATHYSATDLLGDLWGLFHVAGDLVRVLGVVVTYGAISAIPISMLGGVFAGILLVDGRVNGIQAIHLESYLTLAGSALASFVGFVVGGTRLVNRISARSRQWYAERVRGDR